jgi:tRNA(Ile)-lysidine synthase TilS/MesJ
MIENHVICKNCILVDGFLGIKINEDQLCNFCVDPGHVNPNWSKVEITKEHRRKFLQDWTDVVKKMQDTQDKIHYHCVIGYSGGKDSTALIDTIVNEYYLNPLLVSIDTGFMTDVAKQNMRDTLAKMDLFENHLLIENAIPTFTKLYHYYFLSHDSAEKALTVEICHKCTDLIHTIIIKEALKRDIPYIIIGFSPDQIARYFYETGSQEIIDDGTPLSTISEILSEEDRSWYLNQEEIDKIRRTSLRVLYPYHVLDYDEKEIISRLESKGLIQKGKGDPVLTNCHVVKAALFHDFYRYGGISYALQYSELIRQESDPQVRKVSRKNWLRTYKQIGRGMLNGTFNHEGMEIFFRNLEISKEQLLQRIEEKQSLDPERARILRNIEQVRFNKLR